jgi:hypothetical protein
MNEITFLKISRVDDGGPRICSRCYAVVPERWQDGHAQWHWETEEVEGVQLTWLGP